MRWAWYEDRQDMVDSNGERLGMGTLGCLPAEIRNQIYRLAFDDLFKTVKSSYNSRQHDFRYDGQRNQDWENLGNWQFHYQPRPRSSSHSLCGTSSRAGIRAPHFLLSMHENDLDVFDLRSYLPSLIKCGYSTSNPFPFRQASKRLQTELDSLFLGESTFKFHCPVALQIFLEMLSPTQHSLLSGVILEIMGRCDCFGVCDCCGNESSYREWMEVCRSLPQGLQSLRSVKFEVGYYSHPIPYGGRAGYWSCDGAWNGGGPKYVERLPEVADLLELLANQFSRSTPKAEIGLVDGEYLDEEAQSVIGTVLSNIEKMEYVDQQNASEAKTTTLSSGLGDGTAKGIDNVDEEESVEDLQTNETGYIELVDEGYFFVKEKKRPNKFRRNRGALF